MTPPSLTQPPRHRRFRPDARWRLKARGELWGKITPRCSTFVDEPKSVMSIETHLDTFSQTQQMGRIASLGRLFFNGGGTFGRKGSQ